MTRRRGYLIDDLPVSHEYAELKARGLATFVKRNKTIVLNPGYEYEIDLEKITTPTHVLDWIAHLSEKNWCSPQMLSDFLYLVRKHWMDFYTGELKHD